MVRRYRDVLSVPGVPRLFASALLARLPQGMSSLAILLLVRGRTGSYAAAGIAVGVSALASAAAAPLQGRLVDRFGRRRVLLPLALGQALSLLALAVSGRPGPVVLIGLAGIAGASLPPLAPAVRALLGEVITQAGVREVAYSLDSVVQELIWTAGPLLVAGLIAAASPALAVVVIGAIGLIGTGLFVASPLAAGAGSRRGSDDHALANPALRSLLGPIALNGFALGCVEVGLPSLALHAGSRTASGLLLALWSIGSGLGGLWYGGRSWEIGLTVRYRGLLLAGVVCAAPLIVARTIPEGAVASLLAGLTIAPVFACQYALVGRSVRVGAETEAFTWVSAALVAGLAAGNALGGATISTAGVSGPFVLACVGLSLAAAAAVRALD
jgi:MFS family permease